MSQMDETKNSIHNKFTMIMFKEEGSTKSKYQAVHDYLENVQQNEDAYNNSPMYVPGIFSYKKEAPIKNWLQNSAESLRSMM